MTVILGDPRLPDKVKKKGQFNIEDKNTVKELKKALKSLAQLDFKFQDNHKNLMKEMLMTPPRFVLNFCDEGFQNEATMELHIPALLEMLNIPYTGATPATLALCYDKQKVNAIAAALNIPVPLETVIDVQDRSASIPDVLPAIMKPACGDSSVGITQDAVVHNKEELINYLDVLHTQFPNQLILIQEFLTGSEYTVGIIGNESNLEVLPVLEVDYRHLPKHLPQLLSYESKWFPDSPYWQQISYQEANMTQDQYDLIIDYSKLLFRRLDCRDYARFDYRCDQKGQIKLLEVNPNPGWCWDGKMNMMARIKGYTYTDLLKRIIETAFERYEMDF